MGAQLCLSNNYQNVGIDYKALDNGNMIAANDAEEKILGVGTKVFADELEIRGTTYVSDTSS